MCIRDRARTLRLCPHGMHVFPKLSVMFRTCVRTVATKPMSRARLLRSGARRDEALSDDDEPANKVSELCV